MGTPMMPMGTNPMSSLLMLMWNPMMYLGMLEGVCPSMAWTTQVHVIIFVLVTTQTLIITQQIIARILIGGVGGRNTKFTTSRSRRWSCATKTT
jgi:hypothetical protein